VRFAIRKIFAEALATSSASCPADVYSP